MTSQSRSHAAEVFPVRLTVADTDQHRATARFLTGAAALGVVAAVAMALFGLPSVDLHGPLHHLGIMDPLCGGTRAARLTARGDLGGAWTYNPLGILAVAGASAMIGRAALGVLTHRWINLQLRLTRRQTRVVLLMLAALTVALAVRQQLQADLLMSHP